MPLLSVIDDLAGSYTGLLNALDPRANQTAIVPVRYERGVFELHDRWLQRRLEVFGSHPVDRVLESLH